MAETLSIPPAVPTSADPEWLRGSDRVPVIRVRPREAAPELCLRQALAAFDRARSWDETRAARDRLLALGREVLPSVLAELSVPQPPERFDVLLALLVQWESPEDAIELAISEGSGPVFRSALAEALGRFVDGAYASDIPTRDRIASCFALLVRDPDAGVRIAAVEAVGLSGLAANPGLRDALNRAASDDRSANVRKETRAVLDETD